MRISDWSSDVCSSDLPADIAALNALPMGEGTVESTRSALVGKTGENVAVRRFERFETANQLASYVHGGRIGVLVDFSGPEENGKDHDMKLAATNHKAPNHTSGPGAQSAPQPSRKPQR